MSKVTYTIVSNVTITGRLSEAPYYETIFEADWTKPDGFDDWPEGWETKGIRTITGTFYKESWRSEKPCCPLEENALHYNPVTEEGKELKRIMLLLVEEAGRFVPNSNSKVDVSVFPF